VYGSELSGSSELKPGDRAAVVEAFYRAESQVVIMYERQWRPSVDKRINRPWMWRPGCMCSMEHCYCRSVVIKHHPCVAFNSCPWLAGHGCWCAHAGMTGAIPDGSNVN